MGSKLSEQEVRTQWRYANMQPGGLPFKSAKSSDAKGIRFQESVDSIKLEEEQEIYHEKVNLDQPRLAPFFSDDDNMDSTDNHETESNLIDGLRRSFRESFRGIRSTPSTPKTPRATPSTPKTPRAPRVPNFWTPLLRRASRKTDNNESNKLNELQNKFQASKTGPEQKIEIENGAMLNKATYEEKGIQEIILNKDDNNKLGLKVKNIKNGVYVMCVVTNSPAHNAGIFPGDRILQINGIKVDKYDDERMSETFRKLNPKEIRFLINKRPLEKTITVHKDQNGQLGMQLRGPKIHVIVRGSPAEAAGLSTDYYILEINGKKIKGVKEEDVIQLMKNCDSLTIKVLPWYLYEPLFRQIPIR